MILTYDCNFRCTYCDIHKRKEDMHLEIFNQTLVFIKESSFDIEKMKFFGGEPLLQKKYIEKAIQNLSEKISDFYVTTNASLLSEKFVLFAQKNNLHITVSLDWDQKTTEQNRKTLSGKSLYAISLKHAMKNASILRVNQVITSETAIKMFDNFCYLYDCGFRKFNFLPEYYREWSKKWLQELIRGFFQIQEFCKSHPIELVNAENYSLTSFFNIGIVIDTNGDIFGTNLILSGDFEKYKPILRIWHISIGLEKDISSIDAINQYAILVESLVAKEYSSSILNSVKYIDRILSNFVYVSSWK